MRSAPKPAGRALRKASDNRGLTPSAQAMFAHSTDPKQDRPVEATRLWVVDLIVLAVVIGGFFLAFLGARPLGSSPHHQLLDVFVHTLTGFFETTPATSH